MLAGAQPYYAPSDPSRNYNINWDVIPGPVWATTQLVYVCSPGNPTGAVMPMTDWEKLFELSTRYGFVIASDECYSEIDLRHDPPLGGLEAAVTVGLADFRNLAGLHQPVETKQCAWDCAAVLWRETPGFSSNSWLYCTYHGCAMSGMVQAASVAAWNDEAHVVANRDLYREKFAAVTPMLAEVLDLRLPDAALLPLGVCACRR